MPGPVTQLASSLLPGLIPGLVPEYVKAEDAFTDASPVELYPEEEAALGLATAARRREFGTVRLCARRALFRLGVTAGPLVPGVQGAPVWPPGVVGSMTHCEGYRAAAVARTSAVAALGIDAEPHQPLPDGVLGVISLERERHGLALFSRSHPAVAWDRLLFSAKESTFKAWFSLTGQSLDFTDCEMTFQPDGFTFTAAVHLPGPATREWHRNTFSGQWGSSAPLGSGHVATVLAIRELHPVRDLRVPAAEAGTATE